MMCRARGRRISGLTPTARHHQIRWLDVAVDQAIFVSVREPSGCLADQLACVRDRQGADAAHQAR